MSRGSKVVLETGVLKLAKRIRRLGFSFTYGIPNLAKVVMDF